jgi:hypothetical protein
MSASLSRPSPNRRSTAAAVFRAPLRRRRARPRRSAGGTPRRPSSRWPPRGSAPPLRHQRAARAAFRSPRSSIGSSFRSVLESTLVNRDERTMNACERIDRLSAAPLQGRRQCEQGGRPKRHGQACRDPGGPKVRAGALVPGGHRERRMLGDAERLVVVRRAALSGTPLGVVEGRRCVSKTSAGRAGVGERPPGGDRSAQPDVPPYPRRRRKPGPRSPGRRGRI